MDINDKLINNTNNNPDTIKRAFSKINSFIEEVAIILEDGVGTSNIEEIIDTKIAELVDGAPATFDTLREIAEWIGNHSDTIDIANQLALKADKVSVDALELIVNQLNANYETLASKTYVDDAVVNFYNKEEVDDKIADLNIGEFATKDELEDLANDVYTKQEVDDKLVVVNSPIKLEASAYNLTMTNGTLSTLPNRTNNVELIPYIRPNYLNGVSGSYGVSIGSHSYTDFYGVSIGAGANGGGYHSVSVGYQARSTTGAVAIGANSTAYNKSIVIGQGSDMTSLITNTVTIGPNNFASGENSVNIGFTAGSQWVTNGVAIGKHAINLTNYGVVLGSHNVQEQALFIVGSGTADDARRNTFMIDTERKAKFYNIANYDGDFSADFTDNSLVSKKYVDSLLTNVGGGSGTVDLSDYYTSSQVDGFMSNYMTYYDLQSQFDSLISNGGSGQHGLLTMKEFDGLKADGEPIKVLGIGGEYGYQNYSPGYGNIPYEGLYIVNYGYEESFIKGGTSQERWIVGYNRNEYIYEPGFYVKDENDDWVHKYVTQTDLGQLDYKFDDIKRIFNQRLGYERAYRTKPAYATTNTNTDVNYLFEGVYPITDANGYIISPNQSIDFEGIGFGYINYFEIETLLMVSLNNRLKPGGVIHIDFQGDNQVWYNISNITINQTMSRFYEDFKSKITNRYVSLTNNKVLVIKSEDLTINSTTETVRNPNKKWFDSNNHFDNANNTNFKIRIRISGELVNASQPLPTNPISAGFTVIAK